MRKRYVLFLILIPLLFLGALFLSWSAIRVTFIEWSLKEYTKKKLGYHLKYEKAIIKTNGVIEISSVTLVPLENKSHSTGEIYAGKAEIDARLIWRDRILSTSLFLYDVSFAKDGINLKTVVNTSPQKHWLFQPILYVNGEGTLEHKGEEWNYKVELDFSSIVKGRVTIEEMFDVRFIWGNRDQMCHAHFNEMDLRIMNTFSSLLSESITFMQGTVSGKLAWDKETKGFRGQLFGSSLEADGFGSTCLFPSVQLVAKDAGIQTWAEHGTLRCLGRSIEELQGNVFWKNGNLEANLESKTDTLQLQGHVELNKGTFNETSNITFSSTTCDGEFILRGSPKKQPIRFIVKGQTPRQEEFPFPIPYSNAWYETEGELYFTNGLLSVKGEALFSEQEKIAFQINTKDDFSLDSIRFSGVNLKANELLNLHKERSADIYAIGTLDVEGEYKNDLLQLCAYPKNIEFKSGNWCWSVTRSKPLEYRFQRIYEQSFLEWEIVEAKIVHLSKGCLANQISCIAEANGEGLHLSQCKLNCNGLEAEADIVITRQDNRDLTIEIHGSSFSGKIPELETLLNQYSLISERFYFPMKGDLLSREGGGYCKCNWGEQFLIQEGIIYGSVSKGELLDSIQDLRFDFTYDLDSQTIVCEGTQGKVRLDETKSYEEYLLVGERFSYSCKDAYAVEFDFWIGDKQRDLIRVAGQSVETSSGIEIAFHPELTHIGAAYPNDLSLSFTPDRKLDELQLSIQLSLSNSLFPFTKMLKKFWKVRPAGVDEIFEKLDQISGDVSLVCGYFGDKDSWLYDIKGKSLSLQEYEINHFSFCGKIEENSWFIEQLRVDDLSIAAELIQEDSFYLVKFLGMEWKDVSLLGMDGTLHTEKGILDANLHLIEVNLHELAKFSPFQTVLQKYQIEGKLKANNGRLHVEAKEGTLNADVTFLASLRKFSLQGVPFHDMEEVKIAYTSQKDLTIEGLQSSFVENSDAIQLQLEKLQLQLVEDDLLVKGFHFTIPNRRLQWLITFLNERFPGTLNSSLVFLLRGIKVEDKIEGVLDFSLNPVTSSAKVRFADNKYQIFDQEMDLKGFLYDKRGSEITVEADWLLFDRCFHLSTSFMGKTFPRGILDVTLPSSGSEESIQVFWEKKVGEAKLQINKIQGSLNGIECVLESSPSSHSSTLEGFIEGKHLVGSVSASANLITFNQLKWFGKEGQFLCPHMRLEKQPKGAWMLFLDKAEGFHIPWKEFSRADLFDDGVMIDYFVLKDTIGNPSSLDSFVGSGFISFTGPKKKTPKTTLFINQLAGNGFKISSGRADFTFGNRKVLLSSFHDMSDAYRLMQFNLNPLKRSEIDFSGALDLSLIAEPQKSYALVGEGYGLKVEGTFEHPTISHEKINFEAVP